MAVVEITGKDGITYTYSIDNRLKEKLDKHIKNKLTASDDDVVFIIDGPERSGKSTFGTQLAKYLDNDFCLDRMCMTPEEFKEAIINAERGQAIIYDEAHAGLSIRRTLSKVNFILTQTMMECGQKNLIIFVILPTFYMLDKYVALFRARGLFHVYRRGTKKGFWRYYNQERKRILYLKNYKYMTYKGVRPNLRGRFTKKYCIPEEEYRKKKEETLMKSQEQKENIYLDQRNRLLYLLWREFVKSKRDIATLCHIYGIKLKERTIGNIIEDIYPVLEPFSMKKKQEILLELKKKQEIKEKIMKHRHLMIKKLENELKNS